MHAVSDFLLGSDRLIALHMAQHLLLIALMAPLLAAFTRVSPHPVAAWIAFVATFLFWHWPGERNVGLKLVELATILGTAYLFWSAAFARDKLGYGARALYVMTAAVAIDLPGVVMIFAPRVLCATGQENAAAFGLTPLQDQQIAGLLMWVPANLVFFSIAMVLFARWMSPQGVSA
ncbi:MAG TPA: cytochrome c oxidase assembly protein [Rhizomicrobium sp.]|nr:cytochrome c oxidase assembly protein [Rhizomicrobium sp.]